MNLIQIKKFISRMLAVPVIRKSVNHMRSVLYSFLSISRIFAIPFHLLFSRAFDREIFAYTHANRQYYRKIKKGFGSNVALRRNIHRLEKGLIMENRRLVFALDYIQETIEIYKAILENPEEISLEPGELLWAHDVLNAYFEVADHSHPLIGGMREIFKELPFPFHSDKKNCHAPYESVKRETLNIPSFEKLFNLSLKRRSIRWFEDRKVPRELVDKAIQVAAQAPSACNRQPFHYRIFDDPQMVEEIASIPFNTAGFADNLPMVIVVVGDLSDFFAPRDRHVIYIDAALSVMSFMFALETLGLSSVAINCPDFGIIENRFKRKLKLAPYERPVIMLGVGYAKKKGKVPYSAKKPLDLLRSYNT